ncbi:nuclear transport factor 2 family protein [Pseudolysobacter antarcticus]|uniref:Nuclear transport factor 2 family protein n=1 Tax=Pseudolysobacter antarcticus TaxID=2511995 RepID=A0A411HLQ6_9GAMM|nr:nuclear transport factor 2 family protein [Pseudolysobacter antarcticus]QBB71455.1 nuclear transport factor 2 family protein [Pseudolysobacter antarcticus]
MTLVIEMLQKISVRSESQGEAWEMQHDPAAIYASYIVAVAQRDLATVLALASEDYAGGLRRSRGSASFMAFFGMWCENYPAHRDVLACFIDGDTAILETVVEIAQVAMPGRVALIHDGDNWRVHSERCGNGHRRMPTPRLSPCKLS